MLSTICLYIFSAGLGSIPLVILGATLYSFWSDDFDNLLVDCNGGGIPGFSFMRTLLALIGSEILRKLGVKSRDLPPCNMKFNNVAVQLETLFQIWKVRRAAERERIGNGDATQNRHNESTVDVPFLYFEFTLFPHLVRYISHPLFPLQALGAVHYRNQTKQHREMPLRDTYNLSAQICLKDTVRHAKGTILEFDFEAYRSQRPNELVWSNTVGLLLFDVLPQQTNDEVQKAPFDFPSETELKDETSKTTKLYLRTCNVPRLRSLPFWTCATLAYLRAAPDSGVQFASVTKDYNPIHLYPFTAKLFGFKKPIVHGMYVVDQCLPLIEETISPTKSFHNAILYVEFRRPIPLPSSVSIRVTKVQSKKENLEEYLVVVLDENSKVCQKTLCTFR